MLRLSIISSIEEVLYDPFCHPFSNAFQQILTIIIPSETILQDNFDIFTKRCGVTLICLASLLPCLSIVLKADPKFAMTSTVTSTSVTVTIPWPSVDWRPGGECGVFKAPGEEEL